MLVQLVAPFRLPPTGGAVLYKYIGHLKSLFENDILSSKQSVEIEDLTSDRKTHGSKMDRIRHQLIKLMPTLEEATYVVETASDWWSIFNVLFPRYLSGGRTPYLQSLIVSRTQACPRVRLQCGLSVCLLPSCKQIQPLIPPDYTP